MYIQRISSHNLYNNYFNNKNVNSAKNQVSFGVGEDYGAEDDVFNKMEERSRAKESYAALGDDTTYWELLFGPKKIKHPIDPSKVESLEEEPYLPKKQTKPPEECEDDFYD